MLFKILELAPIKDKLNDKNFFYKLEKIYKMKNETYKKLIQKTNFNFLMSYDKDNKTIKKTILNLLKWKKKKVGDLKIKKLSI